MKKYILSKRQLLLLGLANAYDKLCICNGCRPAWLSSVLPKKLEKILAPFFNLIFILACSNHDIVYKIGGTEADRKRGDKNFKSEMNQALKESIIYKSSKYKKLEKTKWYQVKFKNILKGFYNVGPGIKNSGKATGYFIKKQYFSFKVFEYYLLVRKFGKDSFNFVAPMTTREEYPSFYPLNSKIGKYNKTFKYQGRIYLESEHKKRMA